MNAFELLAQERDKDLRFGSYSAKINAALFCHYSPLFARSYRQGVLGDPLDISVPALANVTETAFRTWVEACQFQQYEVTAATAPGLLLLSSWWQTTAVLKRVIDDVTANPTELLIDLLVCASERDIDTHDLEFCLSMNFTKFIGGRLLDLGLPVLARVLNRNWSDVEFPNIFQFLLTAIDRFGRPASVLFIALRPGRLGEAELGELDRRDFDWRLFGRELGTRLFRQKRHSERIKGDLERLRNANQ
jgi:hypothetical protein